MNDQISLTVAIYSVSRLKKVPRFALGLKLRYRFRGYAVGHSLFYSAAFSSGHEVKLNHYPLDSSLLTPNLTAV